MTQNVLPAFVLYLVTASALQAAPRFDIGLETALRWAQVNPDDGIGNAFTLPRSEVSFGVSDDAGSAARVVARGIRSAPENGYIGIDGERMVFALEVVEGRKEWTSFGLSLAGGLLENPWVRTGNDAWSLEEIRRSMTSDGRDPLLARTDLAVEAQWGSSNQAIRAWVQVASGEGARYRERNSGKNLVGVLLVRPLTLWKRAAAPWFAVSAYGQEGSRGNQVAREHRFAVRAHSKYAWVNTGVEFMRAQGRGGDPIPEPDALSTWLVLEPRWWGFVYGRFDAITADQDIDESGHHIFDLGFGLRLPMGKEAVTNYAQFTLGYSVERFDEQARPLSGAEAQAEINTLFMQLSLFMGGGIEVQTVP